MTTREKKFFVPKIHPLEGNRDCPKKRWYVWYDKPTKDNQTIRVNIYGDFKKFNTVDAKLKHAYDLMAKVDALRLQYEASKRVKLSHPVITYVESNQHRWERKTYSTYRTKVNLYCLWLHENQIKPDQYTGEQFLSYLSEQRKSPTTINAYRRTLSIIYNKLIKMGKEKINPFKLTEKTKEHKETRMYFTVEQKAALRKVVEPNDPQLWLACMVLYYCFIRPKEMRLLKIGDIVFSEDKIIVPGSIAKNDKTQPVRIPANLKPYLLIYKSYPLDFYLFGKNGEPGLTMVSENSFYNRFSLLMKKSRVVGDRYSFYSWKNTGIYFFLKSKGNIKQLQMQLRHHSLDQVNQYAQDFGLLDCDDIELRFPEI